MHVYIDATIPHADNTFNLGVIQSQRLADLWAKDLNLYNREFFVNEFQIGEFSILPRKEASGQSLSNKFSSKYWIQI